MIYHYGSLNNSYEFWHPGHQIHQMPRMLVCFFADEPPEVVKPPCAGPASQNGLHRTDSVIAYNVTDYLIAQPMSSRQAPSMENIEWEKPVSHWRSWRTGYTISSYQAPVTL